MERQRPIPAGLGPNGIGPRFESAPQPDMVRAVQKDEFFLTMFKDDCRELYSNLLGSRFSQYENAIDFFSNACYHGFTSLIGNPSLGEEYCDLSMVCRDMETRPSRARRGFLFFLEVCVPYVFNKLKALPRPSRGGGILNRAWVLLIDLLSKSDPAFSIISKLHLALFYLFGQYLQLSKRGAGIRYVFLRKLDMPRPGYALLGILIVIHLSVLFLMFMSRLLSHSSDAANAQTSSDEKVELDEDLGTDDSEAEEATTCTICQCPRENTTVTECGHLFCWECITRAFAAKPECPMCRSPCTSTQLLRLSHYA